MSKTVVAYVMSVHKILLTVYKSSVRALIWAIQLWLKIENAPYPTDAVT
jgi:hypothetical protein